MPAKRTDPEDGLAYTYDEIAAHYKGKFKKAAIEAYWEDTCYGKGKAKKEEAAKPKAKVKAKVKAEAKYKVKKETEAPKPVKLHYFPLKAKCFPILLALEVGNVNYEVEKITFDDWPEKKTSGKYPFGYMPALELADGTMINETNAVLFTVGKLARLNGASTKDFGISSMLACKAVEVFQDLTKVQPTVVNVKDWNKDKAKALADATPAINADLEKFEKLCDEDGKFTKLGRTTGELHLFSTLHHMKACKFKTEFGGNLDKFYARVEALDGVKKCLESKSKMGELDDYVRAVP